MRLENPQSAWNQIGRSASTAVPDAFAEALQAIAQQFDRLKTAAVVYADENEAALDLAKFAAKIEQTLAAFAPGNLRERIEGAALRQEEERIGKKRHRPASVADSVMEIEDHARRAAGMAGVEGAEPAALHDLTEMAAAALRGLHAHEKRQFVHDDPTVPLDYGKAFFLFRHLEEMPEAPPDPHLEDALSDLGSRLSWAREVQMRYGNHGGMLGMAQVAATALEYLGPLTHLPLNAIHEKAVEDQVVEEESYRKHRLPLPSPAKEILYATNRLKLAEEAFTRNDLKKALQEIQNIYNAAEHVVAHYGGMIKNFPKNEFLNEVRFPSREEILGRPSVQERLQPLPPIEHG